MVGACKRDASTVEPAQESEVRHERKRRSTITASLGVLRAPHRDRNSRRRHDQRNRRQRHAPRRREGGQADRQGWKRQALRRAAGTTCSPGEAATTSSSEGQVRTSSSCGAGQDIAKGDAKDKIASDCEVVKGVPAAAAAIHGATARGAATSATGAEGTARHLLREHGAGPPLCITTNPDATACLLRTSSLLDCTVPSVVRFTIGFTGRSRQPSDLSFDLCTRTARQRLEPDHEHADDGTSAVSWGSTQRQIAADATLTIGGKSSGTVGESAASSRGPDARREQRDWHVTSLSFDYPDTTSTARRTPSTGASTGADRLEEGEVERPPARTPSSAGGRSTSRRARPWARRPNTAM